VVATPPAVAESLRILTTHRRLFGSRTGRGWGLSMSAADIPKIIEAFERVGARWALVGAHATMLLTEPRATVDFDFIVEARKLKAVLRALASEFGDLGEDDIGAAVRLKGIDVDLIRSDTHPLFAEAIAKAQPAGEWRVPPPEVLIAMKFLSAVNTWRGVDKRGQDLVDLRKIYRAVGADGLDRGYLLRLGALVYPGAERELEALLDKIDRGDPIAV
jgi:hypothetical protein